MLEELIKLCKHDDIKFESTFLFNMPYKYSNKEELRKLFWLTELRQFIFNKLGVYVAVDFQYDSNLFYYLFDVNGETMISKDMYGSETDALLEGLTYFLNCYVDAKGSNGK